MATYMPGWKCSASCMPTPHEGQALPTKSDWEPYVCSSCVHVQAYHISMFGAPRYENFPARSGGKPLSHGCEHGGASDFRDRAGLVRRIAGCLLGPVERKTPSQQYRSSDFEKKKVNDQLDHLHDSVHSSRDSEPLSNVHMGNVDVE